MSALCIARVAFSSPSKPAILRRPPDCMSTTTAEAARVRALLTLVLIALSYFSLTRIGLLIFSFADSAPSFSSAFAIFCSGLVYDLAFCSFAALPLALWMLLAPRWVWNSRPHRALFHAFSFAAIYGLGFIAVAEGLFWDEFQVRFNFVAVDYLIYTQEVTENIDQSYPMAWILGGILLASFVTYALARPQLKAALAAQDSRKSRLAAFGTTCLMAGGAFFFVDQDLRGLFPDVYQRELASNGIFQFVAAFKNNEIDYTRFYATREIEQVDRDLRSAITDGAERFSNTDLLDLHRKVSNPARSKPLNLILVMVESLDAQYLARYGSPYGLTPELDRLADQSLVFDRMYATGTRTTRGLEAVTLSLPPTPGRSIVKRIGREKDMQSLGNVLNTAGYRSCFVYGGRGFFDNMNAFFGGNGYDIIDQSSASSDDVGFTTAWGMADEDLFRLTMRAADEAHDTGNPFFFHVMTTSNHRPYMYPAGRIDIPSGTGRAGAVKYTDWAIGNFIRSASKHAWFEDTMFVVIADHCGSSAGKVDLPVDRYHIPLLIYSPANIEPGSVSLLASQIDVAPTLLSLMGISYSSTFFGRNLLECDPDSGHAWIGNYQHLGMLEDGILTVLSPKQEVTQRRVESEPILAQPPDMAALLDRSIAYYQGASYVFAHHLNAWQGSLERVH